MRRLASSIVWSGRALEGAVALEGRAGQDLSAFLSANDGLVAFEGGLRCFGVADDVLPGLADWNHADGWRSSYRGLSDGLYFFAEDAFGNQFAFEDDRIIRFLAETADREFLTDSLEEWIDLLVRDPDEELGLWLLRDWRSRSDMLTFKEHLCPKIPFVLGGRNEADNLYALDRTKSMVFKGDLAWQTRKLPDGAKIRLKVTR